MGNQVFTTPPELDRAHRALTQKPKAGQPPRPIIVAFHRYQDRERALRWARQNDVLYKGKALRFYLLSKKRAPFKTVKAALYQKGIPFRLLYPARLRVTHGSETLVFDTLAEAEAFVAKKVEVSADVSDGEHED